MTDLKAVQRQTKAVLRRAPGLRAAVLATRHRGLRRDDCFIASFPRSGNTWLRFLLADLAGGHAVDYEHIDRTIPGVGQHLAAPPLASGARLIKTHEPYRPVYTRAVYLVRDVRDVVLSWYRITRHDRDNFAGFDRFFDEFVAGTASPYGKWTDHVRSWVGAPSNGAAVLLMRYEDLQRDPLTSLRRVAMFTDLPHSDAELTETLDRCSLAKMQQRQRENAGYLRKTYDYRTHDQGEAAGGWRHKLDQRHLDALGPALALGEEVFAQIEESAGRDPTSRLA